MDNKSGERDDNADGEMERNKPAYSLHRLRVCVCVAAHGLGSNAGSQSFLPVYRQKHGAAGRSSKANHSSTAH